MSSLSGEQKNTFEPTPLGTTQALRFGVVWALAAAVLILAGWLCWDITQLDAQSAVFRDSTLGELSAWMIDQAEQDAPRSPLAQYAKSRQSAGTFELPTLLNEMYSALWVYTLMLGALAAVSVGGLLLKVRGHRLGLLVALMGINALVFIIPPTANEPTVSLILGFVVVTGSLLLLSAPHVERYVGFLVILAFAAVIWQASKAVARWFNYQVTLPVPAIEYRALPQLEDALTALQTGALDVLIIDRNDVRDLMPAHNAPADDTLPYPTLRYVTDFNRQATRWGQPITPSLAGRLVAVLPAEQAATFTDIAQLSALSVGTVTASFAEENFFSVARQWVLVDMKIANNLNLPNLQSIAEALLQPARRNGEFLLVRILYDAALYTWTEALLGFLFGAALGFLLGSLFAHVPLLQRSLLPYVVASQTIPIIALAPMIVIWLRGTHPILPVAVISAYLTFFPVTINTLRGLQSPDPMSLDLMRSYAANAWQTMWKVRFPSSLPYIFTALKVSATASVVGAIIGELPSGIRNGLGRAILDFSSDYSLTSTPKLWAAIFMASLLGILFFVIVLAIESLVLRGQVEKK